MPDIINNVINQVPSSGHSIYVTELDAFGELQTKFRGGYRVSKTSATQSHMWDLYALGYKQFDRYTDPLNNINYYTKRFSSSKYFPIFCSNFNDNAGDGVYAQLPNYSGLSVLNHPRYSSYIYSGSFTFSPLWCTSKRNAQNTGEYILYRASYKPLMPIMLCSSIPTHKTFGPAFLRQFSISVDGSNSLGDVEISCEIQGGRVLISPSNIPIYKPYTDGSIIRLATLDQSQKFFINENENYNERYRAYNLGDCAYAFGVFTGDGAFERFAKAATGPYADNRTPPVHKIISMSLNISQEIDFVFTYPGFSYLKYTDEFYDIAGPRFASLSNRQVSGSIKLFCPTNYNFLNTNASSFTMYFGSVYFYSMKNVDWQQPKVNINPGGGYTIEYSFVARMGEDVYFNYLGNDRVSEFLIL